MSDARYYRLNRYDGDGLVSTETFPGDRAGLHRAVTARLAWTDQFGYDDDYASITPVL